MARQLRVEYAGAIYHVTVRSNGKDNLFDDDLDRRYFLSRIEEAVKTHQVRVYLFCLMPNHFHLVLETPKANLGRFMQGILTGYGVYYNRRHSRHGHVTQGRYGAKLIKGDDYLLKLSRYVHLNPVKVKGLVEKPPEELVAYLKDYPWSTYQSYIGIRPANKFVDYEPILSLMDGRKSEKFENYRRFADGGIGVDDEVFLGDLVRSSRSIGSEEYRDWVDDCYRELVDGREKKEDASFRRIVWKIPADEILEAVAKAAKCRKEHLTTRRRETRWRSVTGLLLCKYGGMTQREAATILGLQCGSAVSAQLRALRETLIGDVEMSRALAGLNRKLSAKQR
ncbi:MAG: transposase [bacterium]